MSDELITSALTHGGTLLTGGGVSALVVRFLFADVAKRLEKIEKTLEDSIAKADQRHETMIERLVKVESRVDAAHRRLDEQASGRKR